MTQPTLQIVPNDDLIDVPRHIVVEHVPAGARCWIHTRTRRGRGVFWSARAAFRADAHGCIDLQRDAPLADTASTYDGVSAMGLIWSQTPEQEGAREVFPDDVTEAIETEFSVMMVAADRHADEGDEGELTCIARARLTQRLMRAGVRRSAMRDEGCVGTLFHPAEPGPHPAVMVLNGSGGGINEARGALYASHGYIALALGYFKTPGLSDYISNTPLEYFRRALDWMYATLRPKDDFIALSGQSRGGELALLLGATYPERIKAVIAYVPGAVVHSAQNAADPATGREGPTWLLDGKPLPHLWENNRTASWAPYDKGPTPRRHAHAILTALQDPVAVERARIRVERITGPVLLISAGDDGSWPSSDYSTMVVERLAAHRHPHIVDHLDFDGAGHAIVFPFVPTTQLVYAHPVSGHISTGGGSPAANARADTHSWRGVLAFLQHAAPLTNASSNDKTRTDDE